MALKVFISYNHKDMDVAVRVSQALQAAGLEVIRDAESMRSGENIKNFIMRCIRESGVTLAIISRNSLLSSWVAMESVVSHFESDMGTRYFIPAYIDDNFFGRTFTDDALDEVDKEIEELNSLITRRLEKDRGIRDLEDELARYRRLKGELDDIIGRLRGMLCINISGDEFDKGMAKIIQDIKNTPTASGQEPNPTTRSADKQPSAPLDEVKGKLRDLFAQSRPRKLFRELNQILAAESDLRRDLDEIQATHKTLEKDRSIMYPQDYNTQYQLAQRRLLTLIDEISPEDLASV